VAKQRGGGAGRQQPPAPAASGTSPELVKKYAWPEKPAIIGTSVKRLDGPDKVTGRAKYTFDINRPGMIYGRVIRSPHPHARIVAIDLSDAQKAPGVRAALEHKPAGGQVMYQGDAVAAVAADTEDRAMYTMSSPSRVATEKLSRSTADIRSRIGCAAVDSELEAE